MGLFDYFGGDKKKGMGEDWQFAPPGAEMNQPPIGQQMGLMDYASGYMQDRLNNSPMMRGYNTMQQAIQTPTVEQPELDWSFTQKKGGGKLDKIMKLAKFMGG